MRYIDLPLVVNANSLSPRYSTRCAAAMTLFAETETILRPLEPIRVSAGVAIEMPPAMMAVIGCHRGQAELGIMAAPETIGADDRGPITVLLTWITAQQIVHGRSVESPIGVHFQQITGARQVIKPGDPIAEISFVPLVRVRFGVVAELRSPPGVARETLRVDAENYD